MVKVPEVYLLNKDMRAFERRVAWLDKRLATEDPARGGAGFDQAERDAFQRLLVQVRERGISLDTPRETTGTTPAPTGR